MDKTITELQQLKANFDKNYNEIMDQLQIANNQTKELQQKLNLLNDLKQIEDSIQKHQQIADQVKQKQKIKLNIGGDIFVTSAQTLLKEKGCLFVTLLNSKNYQVDAQDEEIFIDRSGKQFEIILNYLRGYDIIKLIQEMNQTQYYQLMQDIDFYQITSLKDTLSKSIQIEFLTRTTINQSAYQIQRMVKENGYKFKKLSENGWNLQFYAKLSKVMLPDITLKINILTIQNDRSGMVFGFSNSPDIQASAFSSIYGFGMLGYEYSGFKFVQQEISKASQLTISFDKIKNQIVTNCNQLGNRDSQISLNILQNEFYFYIFMHYTNDEIEVHF